jgi:hypothetical protein
MACQMFIDSIRGLNPDLGTEVPTSIRVQGHVITDAGSVCSVVLVTLSLVSGGTFHGQAQVDTSGAWTVDLPNPNPQTNIRAFCGSVFRIAVECANDSRCRVVSSGQLLCEDICGIEVSPLYVAGENVNNNVPGILKVSGTAVGCTKVTVYLTGMTSQNDVGVVNGQWVAQFPNPDPVTGTTYVCHDKIKLLRVVCKDDENCFTYEGEIPIECNPVDHDCVEEAVLVVWWLDAAGQRQLQPVPPLQYESGGTGCHPVGEYIIEVLQPPAGGIVSYEWRVNNIVQSGQTGREFHFILCPDQTPLLQVEIRFDSADGCPDVTDSVQLEGCTGQCPDITNVIRVDGCYPGTVRFRALGTNLPTGIQYQWEFSDGITATSTTNEVVRNYAGTPGINGIETARVVIPITETCCGVRSDSFPVQIPKCGSKDKDNKCPRWNPRCWNWREISCDALAIALAVAIAAWIVAVGMGLWTDIAQELTDLVDLVVVGATVTAQQVEGVAGGIIGLLLTLSIQICGRCKTANFIIAGAILGWLASLVLSIYQAMTWVGFGWASVCAILWLAAGLVLRRGCK